MVGDNPTAQDIYERLQRGETPAFKTAPTGVPPLGGTPFPTQADMENPPPRMVEKGFRSELMGVVREILALQKQQMEELRLLRSDLL
jgi:hypothetical protein